MKVIDEHHRLRHTLLHEMCHAAQWLVDGKINPPHGSLFKKWANHAMERDKNLYKSCILLGKFNSPPNLVRDKGIYSTRAGSILTSAGLAWDLRVQLMEYEGEDQ